MIVLGKFIRETLLVEGDPERVIGRITGSWRLLYSTILLSYHVAIRHTAEKEGLETYRKLKIQRNSGMRKEEIKA